MGLKISELNPVISPSFDDLKEISQVSGEDYFTYKESNAQFRDLLLGYFSSNTITFSGINSTTITNSGTITTSNLSSSSISNSGDISTDTLTSNSITNSGTILTETLQTTSKVQSSTIEPNSSISNQLNIRSFENIIIRADTLGSGDKHLDLMVATNLIARVDNSGFLVDVINERQTNVGVTIEGQLIKDSKLYSPQKDVLGDAKPMPYYEIGSWTITIGDGTNAFTGITQNGYYIRFEDQIFVNGHIAWTGKGSASGTIQIALPFAISNQTNYVATFALGDLTGITIADALTAEGQAGNQYLSLYSVTSTSTSAALTNTGYATAGKVRFSGNYLIETESHVTFITNNSADELLDNEGDMLIK